MKFKSIILLSLFSFIISISSYGNENDHKVYFHPVKEIFVDELPEPVADLEFVHSTSKLPVVFRGAAKNWEAMNWTPAYLKQNGIDDIEKILILEKPYPQSMTYTQCINFSKDGTRKTDNLDELHPLFEDIHYHEQNIYKDITKKDMALLQKNANFQDYSSDDSNSILYYNHYQIHILIGSKKHYANFHVHGTALLAEFYGEKIVFLAEPHTKSKLVYGQLNDESNRIINDFYNQDLDESFDINSSQNNDYFPFQQVILKPGDILYIPSGWYHKVYYLTPCIGSTQFIGFDKG